MSSEHYTCHSHVFPVIATFIECRLSTFIECRSIILVQFNDLLSSSLGSLGRPPSSSTSTVRASLWAYLFYHTAMPSINQRDRGRPRDLDGGSSRCEFMPRAVLLGECATITAFSPTMCCVLRFSSPLLFIPLTSLQLTARHHRPDQTLDRLQCLLPCHPRPCREVPWVC